MDDVRSLVVKAKAGDLDAFGEIVGRFQAMAYGCAYAVLGDFHLAEDAAQEAFLQAYRDLASLNEPGAFPAWFRQIVLRQCNRITRRKAIPAVSLDAAAGQASGEGDPASAVEAGEMRRRVLDAVNALPEHERMVTTLFYIDGYSQQDIADFLEVPATTVNNRLHASRKRLKERMITMVADEMKSHPLPPEFPARIRQMLERPRPLEIGGHPVREAWLSMRAAFPDFEVIELDEICSTETMAMLKSLAPRVFSIDADRLLRPEMTPQVLDRWIREGGGHRKWLAVGRVFRDEEEIKASRLAVFHQAELFCSGPGMDGSRLEEMMLRAARAMLPGRELRINPLPGLEYVQPAIEVECAWRDGWVGLGGGGVFVDRLARQGKLASGESAIGFAYGLERCAMVSRDIDSIRALWEPPYVP